ncbi:MAG: flavin reductase family protein [Candidatus Ratteibacteria bacterium]
MIQKECIKIEAHAQETLQALEKGRVILISSTQEGAPAGMTIGWGHLGIVWRKPIFIAYVRPSRYTREILDASGLFSINVLPASMQKTAHYFGSISGRNEDKFKTAEVATEEGVTIKVPHITDATVVYECRVIYSQGLDEQKICDEVKHICYHIGDFHMVYFGEILACLTPPSQIKED